jgi:hypothetical protein
MWWFNRQRNGYRMACKPPECRQLSPLHRSCILARVMRGAFRREQAHEGVSVGPAASWLPAVQLSARPASAGHSRRNAVGRVGVKLGAAPDAPHWGKVLVRTPSDRFLSNVRVRAASKFTCLSREYRTCLTPVTDPGGGFHGKTDPRPRWLASSGGGGRGGRIASRPGADLRIARYPAWTAVRKEKGGQAESAAKAAGTTRQRASWHAPCGRACTPGRTPCERNHGSVLR